MGNHPPKNKIVPSELMRIIAEYSPKKNIANSIDEYSVKYPATKADSSSGKSNGARFVSARAEIIKTINIGNKGRTNQQLFCAITISFKFNEPTHNSTQTITSPIETSYETICAADLKAPRKAYFELLAQPAIIIPYIDNEETANKYKIPTFMLERTKLSEIGITLQATNDKEKEIMGAKINIILLELAGIIVSFEKSFNPSANGCNKPKKPTTFGPFLNCTDAITFLSKYVKKATATNNGPIINKTYKTIVRKFITFEYVSKST